MSLAAGSRLGVYEILSPLGAGGMGEVYLARDPRLGRDVAIKILPADVVGDPERLARFEREAQAVSALNHPHIVTVYEVGSSDAGPYLVMERIDGQSLRDLLHAGPLPIRRILTLGAQIAEGLAKAHAAGIVHRDLKPENVMVTADGFAKILDFGLAKLAWPELGAGASETTLAKHTSSGVVLGTIGYLSPEQASGHPVDYRTDQFALGALLYEVTTGVRPFRRNTVLESLTATIREEAEPLRSKRPDAPAQLGWLVERCLAKDPNDRYASTKDLARSLGDLRDHLSDLTPGSASGALALGRRRRWLAPALAAMVLAAVAVGSFVAGRRTVANSPLPTYRPLTFRRGTVTGARFSPDGKTIYYSAAFGDEPSRVYVTHLERTESEPLKLPPGFLLSVSKKDELLVLLTNERAAYNSRGTLARVPAIGGTPRALVEGATYADWAPDGERLAVVRASALEFPVGHPIAGNWGMARVSPSGDRIGLQGNSRVEIQDLEGRRVASYDIVAPYGIAWAPDGQELWFTGSESGGAHDRALYALSLGGARRLIARMPGAMTVYDVAQDRTSALIATGAGWAGISGARVGADRETPLDLLGRSDVMGLSADGTRLLANELREVGSGIYLRPTDGTAPIHLSDDVAMGLSPDGAWALVHPRGNASRLMLLPTGAGPTREVPLDPTLEVSPSWYAQWSDEGRRLFVLLRAAGGDGPSRVYVRDGDGPWRAVTPEGNGGPFAASPDGQTVAVRDRSGTVALFPVVGGGAPRELPDEHGRPTHWSADGRQLFLAGPEQMPVRIYRRDLTTGRIEPWRTITPADPTAVMSVGKVFIARDDQSYIYQYSRGSNDLFLAQGLR